MSALLVVIILSFLVIIHELGHLLAALRAKVKVEEFGLGYPPKIHTAFKWRNIPFTLNAIPFGGFVRMSGEDAQPGQAPEKGDFRTASWFSRASIILAGVTMNLIYGIAIFSIIYTIIGIPVRLENEARIGLVAPDSPAEQAGLQENMKIISIEGDSGQISNPSVTQVQDFVKENQGQTIEITTQICEQTTCQKNLQTFEILLRNQSDVPEGQGMLGVVFTEEILVHYPLWQMPFRGIITGFQQAMTLGVIILQALGDMIVKLSSGTVPSDVAGPIGIAAQAESMNLLAQGWIFILIFSAMISINLAIMNILPIPPLDGGRMLFLLLEPIISKKYLEKMEYWANYSGFVILIALIIAISAKDIWSIFM